MFLQGNAQEFRSLTTAEFFEEIATETESGTLVNFWATWCGPCVKELPLFNQLAEEHPDLRFVFVSLDMRTQALEAFLETHEFNGEVWFLTDGLRNPDWIGQLDESWSGAIPATLAVDGQKEIHKFYEGEFGEGELEEWLPFDLSGE